MLICVILQGLTFAPLKAQPYDSVFHSRYHLKQMVVMSRHNIRSPLSTNGSTLSQITSHKWHKWSAAPSELTLKGGILETMMGQYFRQWVVREGLMTENYLPKDGEIRVYANSMQRTIATAQYFSSGFLPIANVKVNRRFRSSRMDSIFHPQLTDVSPGFVRHALGEINAMGGKDGLKGYCHKLLPAYHKLVEVLDADTTKLLLTDNDTQIHLKLHDEPTMSGSLKLANQAADALILQYYEEPNAAKAAFGHQLSDEDWELISSIKDAYGDLLFTAPTIATQVAHPLLCLLDSEIVCPGRKFTFLSGHDSNLSSILAALGAKYYTLPGTIEHRTPIGSALVLERWVNNYGQEFIRIQLVYQTSDQLRYATPLTLENPPARYTIQLDRLQPNNDGLLTLRDFRTRLMTAIRAINKPNSK